MKILIQILAFLLLSQVAQGQTKNNENELSKNIEMLCKLDTGADIRYTIDISEKKLYLTLSLNSGGSGFPIKITDQEIRHETRHTDGTLLMLIKIDRFTLDIRQYNFILQEATKNRDGWISGRCELLKRML